MRRIAIINQKGGVGKTTTTVNLGCGIAQLGKRVLLIDLDPQAHLTMHLGIEPDSELPNIYNVLTGSASLEEILKQVSENVLVAPSTIDLAGAEIELASTVGREVILRDAIEEYPKEYDFLLMDCPPSLGLLTINALCSADEIFITLQPHFLALQGMGKLLETIQLVCRRINHNLKVTGVILCMYDSGTKLANVAEAPSFGQDIFTYASTSHGAEDYLSLAKEILGDSAISIDEQADKEAEDIKQQKDIPDAPLPPNIPPGGTHLQIPDNISCNPESIG